MIALVLAALLQSAASESADATIVNSGSTNRSGYTLVVHPEDATADVTRDGSTTRTRVGDAQAKWLFTKLRSAPALGELGAGGCARSASFGSTTTVAFRGQTTGDLGCGRDPASRELSRTIGVIARQLGISASSPRFLLHP